MNNFLKETVRALERAEKSFDDVIWIGSNFDWKGATQLQISKEVFLKEADFEYEAGSMPRIATSLVIVGKDWWLERHHDGFAEWWEFKILPKRPIETGIVYHYAECTEKDKQFNIIQGDKG